MNGYKNTADAYRRLLETDKNIDREYTQRKIKALDFLSECNQQEIQEVFNSSAFNNIVKGYLLMACKNAGIDDETRKELFNELRYLFDEKTADEAENYYYSH